MFRIETPGVSIRSVLSPDGVAFASALHDALAAEMTEADRAGKDTAAIEPQFNEADSFNETAAI